MSDKQEIKERIRKGRAWLAMNSRSHYEAFSSDLRYSTTYNHRKYLRALAFFTQLCTQYGSRYEECYSYKGVRPEELEEYEKAYIVCYPQETEC